MNNDKHNPLCPACRQGHLHKVTHNQVFRPRGVEVVVELLASKCDVCGVQTTRASQHDENLRRLAARKSQYGRVLMGEEIMSLRKRYGLTQQAAARVFGKGKIAFSRYENEVTYPDDGTMLMLSMAIEKPDSMKWLADRAGVELPLWRERCEDGRLSLRLLVAHDVHVTKSARTAFRSSVADWTGGIVGWQSNPRKIRKIQPCGNDVIPMLEAA